MSCYDCLYVYIPGTEAWHRVGHAAAKRAKTQAERKRVLASRRKELEQRGYRVVHGSVAVGGPEGPPR